MKGLFYFVSCNSQALDYVDYARHRNKLMGCTPEWIGNWRSKGENLRSSCLSCQKVYANALVSQIRGKRMEERPCVSNHEPQLLSSLKLQRARRNRKFRQHHADLTHNFNTILDTHTISVCCRGSGSCSCGGSRRITGRQGSRCSRGFHNVACWFRDRFRRRHWLTTSPHQ